MTYLQFHFVFTIPLAALLFCLARGTRLPRWWVPPTLILIFVALSYTALWDSYLIRSGVWTYPEGAVVGTFLQVPYEEYFFIAIQTFIACTWARLILNDIQGEVECCIHPYGALLILLPAVLYFASEPKSFRYFYLILAWALPVLALQWTVALKALWHFRKKYLMIVLPLVTYFCIADTIAIRLGIWSFPEGASTGLTFSGGLPAEEALFFLVTNCMVAQGFLLYQVLPMPRRWRFVTR